MWRWSWSTSRVTRAPLNPPVLLLPARFEFSEGLRTRLLAPAQVVQVFDRVVMQGHEGAVATVEIPPGTSFTFIIGFIGVWGLL